MPFPSPGDLQDARIKPWSPALQVDFLLNEVSGKPIYLCMETEREIREYLRINCELNSFAQKLFN